MIKCLILQCFASNIHFIHHCDSHIRSVLCLKTKLPAVALSPAVLESTGGYESLLIVFPPHELKAAQDEREGFICTGSSHDVTQSLEQKGLFSSQVPWKPAHLSLLVPFVLQSSSPLFQQSPSECLKLGNVGSFNVLLSLYRSNMSPFLTCLQTSKVHLDTIPILRLLDTANKSCKSTRCQMVLGNFLYKKN